MANKKTAVTTSSPVSLRLSDRAAEALDEVLAITAGKSRALAIREAILFYHAALTAQRDGATVVFQKDDGDRVLPLIG